MRIRQHAQGVNGKNISISLEIERPIQRFENRIRTDEVTAMSWWHTCRTRAI